MASIPPFPLFVLGTDTDYTPERQEFYFQYLSADQNFPEAGHVDRPTVYVKRISGGELQYRSKYQKDGKELYSDVGHVYHANYFSTITSLARRIFSLIAGRDIYYRGSIQKFTDDNLNTPDIQYAIYHMGSTKTFKDGDKDYPRVPNARYLRGETLSRVASDCTEHVATKVGTVIGKYMNLFPRAAPDTVPFHVVEGPNTLGTNVGKKICDIVIRMLVAIAAGEKHFVVSAHSRGAVEALLSAHDLQAILKHIPTANLEGEQAFADFLKLFPCQFTKAAFNAMDQAKKGELIGLLQEVKQKAKELDKIKLCIHALDPVPGNAPAFLTNVGDYISWRDPRMFSVPAIVSHYYCNLKRHERSEAFKAAVPNRAESAETVVSIESDYGHHGSSSGSVFDQQGGLNRLATEETDEQRALLNPARIHECKLRISLGTDKDGMRVQPSSFSLPVSNLFFSCGSAVAASAPSAPVARHGILLESYEQLHRDRDKFACFIETNYTCIGRVESEDGERLVYFGGYSDTKFSKVVGKPSGSFVNTTHAKLWLMDLLQIQQSPEEREFDPVGIAFLQRIIAKKEAFPLCINHGNRVRVQEAFRLICESLVRQYSFYQNHPQKQDTIVVEIAQVLDALKQYQECAWIFDSFKKCLCTMFREKAEEVRGLAVRLGMEGEDQKAVGLILERTAERLPVIRKALGALEEGSELAVALTAFEKAVEAKQGELGQLAPVSPVNAGNEWAKVTLLDTYLAKQEEVKEYNDRLARAREILREAPQVLVSLQQMYASLASSRQVIEELEAIVSPLQAFVNSERRRVDFLPLPEGCSEERILLGAEAFSKGLAEAQQTLEDLQEKARQERVARLLQQQSEQQSEQLAQTLLDPSRERAQQPEQVPWWGWGYRVVAFLQNIPIISHTASLVSFLADRILRLFR